MKDTDPESWNDAVGIDWAIRSLPQANGSIAGAAYLHRSRKPLSEVDLTRADQSHGSDLDEECDGLCGI